MTLLLDTSGSMGSTGRLRVLETAARAILNNLRPGDRIAAVKFDSRVNAVYPHESPDYARSNPDFLDVWGRGGTNVQEGLDEALWLADRARDENPDAVNYIFLLSDGVANVDATNPFAILHNVGEGQ